MSSSRASLVGAASSVVLATLVSAQAPAPSLRITFAEAIQRARDRNPSVAVAAAGILRAEALLGLARAATLFQLTGNVTTTTLNRGVEFQGATVTPRHQLNASLTANLPIVAAAAWARRAQATDVKNIAELGLADTTRQIAVATADAYLAIIAQRRVVDGHIRARDVAKAHFDLAAELERGGRGSHLNTLRAQQQYTIDVGLVESATLALYRAQEALGVLIAADGAADAADEPAFEAAEADAGISPAFEMSSLARTDLKLFASQQQAAERLVRDSSKEWWPSLDAMFQPSTVYPAQFFLPQNSWRFLLQANVPIADSGQRRAARAQRDAALQQARATLVGATTQANSQVRAAREAIRSGERSLARAREAADQAQQVVSITNISFRAGAATNIEVIDAERSARDADMAVAVGEDSLRRARLELLNALGRFP